METLYLDIETIPAQRPDVRQFFAVKIGEETKTKLAEVKAPSNYKDEVKIAEYINKATSDLLNGEEAAIDSKLAETSFDGSFGQILCVCWSWGDSEIVTSACAIDLSLNEERRVIKAFFDDVYSVAGRRFQVVGHNVAAFDLRFMKQRSIVHGLRPPLSLPFDAKPWDEVIFDTMVQWGGLKAGGSMDKLCLALGIPGKGDISGADVWPMAQAGKFQEICAYCRADVERTRSIHKRMTYQVVIAL